VGLPERDGQKKDWFGVRNRVKEDGEERGECGGSGENEKKALWVAGGGPSKSRGVWESSRTLGMTEPLGGAGGGWGNKS